MSLEPEEFWGDGLIDPDRVRVQGYLIHCTSQVEAAQEDAQRAIADIEKARKRAQRKLAKLSRLTDHLEMLTKVIASGDRGSIAIIAETLEDLEPDGDVP